MTMYLSKYYLFMSGNCQNISEHDTKTALAVCLSTVCFFRGQENHEGEEAVGQDWVEKSPWACAGKTLAP